MGKAVLFKRFLQHPTQVGALCPSSCALCRAMASEIGVENAGLVVELGPGTGVITRELVRRLPENGKLLAVELDELLCEHLKRTFRSRNLPRQRLESGRHPEGTRAASGECGGFGAAVGGLSGVAAA